MTVLSICMHNVGKGTRPLSSHERANMMAATNGKALTVGRQ